MRSRFASIGIASSGFCLILATVATAQRRPPRPTADGGTSADASATVAVAADAGTRRGDAGVVRGMDAGRTTAAAAMDASVSSGEGGTASVNVAPTNFGIPMNQRGNGALSHYPIPEQLARNDVPVFAQVRSSAPLDHVSMHFRGEGATRFRELRMAAMGHDLGLAGGYGAQIPCEDAFPPAIEYYIEVIDTSGAVIGHAGNAQTPIRLPIVTARTHNFVPTLPGQAPPRNCGSITGMSVATTRDSGVATFGTADLGEPCARDSECRRGLRCGLNHQCVFVSAPR